MRPATPTSSAGTAESRSGPRNLAVRWNEPSLLRTTPSSTSAAQGRKSASYVVELRIALCSPHRRGLPHHAQENSSDPQPQTETECCRQRAIEDGDRTRR